MKDPSVLTGTSRLRGSNVLSLMAWVWTVVAIILALARWREVRLLRAQLAGVVPTEFPAPLPSPAAPAAVPVEARPSGGTPSPELLRARADVGQLTRELIARRQSAADSEGRSPDASRELERLMQGRNPSDHPDFVAAESLQNRGFASPEEALETFWWAHAGPDRGVKSEDLWWSPTEPAGEGYHYEIGLGYGVGPFTGYRVLSREEIGPDEVLITLQRQEQHHVIEEEARFIRTDTGWKRKPSIRRVKNDP